MSILKLKYTLPLLMITVVAVGGVKLFYRFLEQKMEVGAPAISMSAPASGDLSAETLTEKVEGPTEITAITRRNLFASRDKAPSAIDREVTAEIGPSSLPVVLMGTITGTDGVERAIIYDKKERKQELYHRGDNLQQAAIKEILRGKVIITLNGRDEVLDIAAARDVKVPQYEKSVPPLTVAERVVGRPLQTEQNPSGNEEENRTDQPFVVPQPQNARQMNTSKEGVIVKGRVTIEQGNQDN